MCGIVGYIGSRNAVPIILDGLRRLEYRGYDSAGIAVVDGTVQLLIGRASGKAAESRRSDPHQSARGQLRHRSYALGDARPSHGRKRSSASRLQGEIVVVHNGIVENYLALKHQLQDEGTQFKTETDTEVIAHLIEKYYHGQSRSGGPMRGQAITRRVRAGDHLRD